MVFLIREAKSILGALLDIFLVAALSFRNPHSYTKFRLINQMRQQTQAKCLIETGTFLGTTADRCARVFKKVYTIELDEKLALTATNFLSKRKNVKVLQGDARDRLAEILKIDEVDSAVVFLDGHFSGGVTACGDLPEPAMELIAILSRFRKKIKGILVDDFRCFGIEPGFPSKSELLKSVETYFPSTDFEVEIFLDLLLIRRKR